MKVDDWKNVAEWIGAALLIALFVGSGYVAVHFIIKYW